MWAIGYSVFPFKLELTHIFSVELFADCRVKGRVWRVQTSGMDMTAHCCRVGTMLLSSHISLPKQQQCASPAHRALTPLLIWSHWQASSQLTAESECLDILYVVVRAQQGWKVAGSKHCMAVNGRDLHSVCKPQPCLKYCRCQSCTSWALYPKPPFYSHRKALQIFLLLQSWEEARENFNSWGNANILKFLILFSVPAFVSPQSLYDSFLASCSPFPCFTFLASQHGSTVGINLTYTAKSVFSVGRTPATAAETVKGAVKEERAHTREVITVLQEDCPHCCHKKPRRSLKPQASQVVLSVSDFLGFWPKSTGSNLQMCWEFLLAIEVDESWALNSLFQYKIRAKEKAQDLEEVFNFGLLPI